jgi:2-polyprenyl-3-methyl-5-hydroxy-6-metoxy-1,4-benzoquinol methylase
MSEPDSIIGTEPWPRCPICGTSGGILYEDLHDLAFGAAGEWTLQRCDRSDCRLLWLDPRPRADEIEKAYRTYYTHAENPAQTDISARAILRSVYRCIKNGYLRLQFGYRKGVGSPWYRLLAPFAFLHPAGIDAVAIDAMFLDAPPSGGRLLEIGCGNGLILERMHERGWAAEGVEFDPKCVEAVRARGLRCYLGDVRDQSLPNESFHAIFMSHVIEHVYDPKGFMDECFRVLKPGGQVIALTPNADGWGHRFFGRDWRGLEPPRHLQIFNQHNLSTVVRAAGFSEINSRTTNWGAWYLYGTSSAIRSARKARLPKVQWHARIFSIRGLCSQIIGRALVRLYPDLGEETILVAKKAEDVRPHASLG